MEKSLPHCLHELMKASEFSDNVRGEAPDLRAGYKAYYDGAGRLPEISVNHLKYVLQHATPAGKLYAAILLSQTKAMSNEQCYAGLLEDKSKVNYASGCEVFTTDVATIAKSLKASGKYLGFQPVYFCSVPLPLNKSADPQIMLTTFNKLKSKVSHLASEAFQKEHADCRCHRFEPAAYTTSFLDTFPVDNIKLLTVKDDEVALPSALLVHGLTEGRFADFRKRPFPGSSSEARVWMTDGNCLELKLHFDTAGKNLTAIETPLGTLAIPEQAGAGKKYLVKTGMTRKETEKYLTIDGGISAPYSYERFIVKEAPQAAYGQVVKVNISFKPAGRSDANYYLGKRARPRQSSGDTVMKVSPFYVEPPYCD